MSIYQKPTIIKSFPAFDIVTFEPAQNGNINLAPEDNLYIDGSGSYMISDAMTYAIKNGECPIESYNQEKERGHDIYWIVALGTMICSNPQKKDRRVALEVGQKINYMGKVFEVYAQNNRNFGLKEI